MARDDALGQEEGVDLLDGGHQRVTLQEVAVLQVIPQFPAGNFLFPAPAVERKEFAGCVLLMIQPVGPESDLDPALSGSPDNALDFTEPEGRPGVGIGDVDQARASAWPLAAFGLEELLDAQQEARGLRQAQEPRDPFAVPIVAVGNEQIGGAAVP